MIRNESYLILQFAACMLHPKTHTDVYRLKGTKYWYSNVLFYFLLEYILDPQAPNIDILFFKHTSGLNEISCQFDLHESLFHDSPWCKWCRDDIVMINVEVGNVSWQYCIVSYSIISTPTRHRAFMCHNCLRLLLQGSPDMQCVSNVLDKRECVCWWPLIEKG